MLGVVGVPAPFGDHGDGDFAGIVGSAGDADTAGIGDLAGLADGTRARGVLGWTPASAFPSACRTTPT
ncbi:hypothetical protein SZMC14600_23015, partial [Saccharomonospora azurea SZMC 14600]